MKAIAYPAINPKDALSSTNTKITTTPSFANPENLIDGDRNTEANLFGDAQRETSIDFKTSSPIALRSVKIYMTHHGLMFLQNFR